MNRDPCVLEIGFSTHIPLEFGQVIFNQLNNNIMIRNKIEKYILSEHHVKHPNLIVGLTITCSIILVGAMLFYIKCSQ